MITRRPCYHPGSGSGFCPCAVEPVTCTRAPVVRVEAQAPPPQVFFVKNKSTKKTTTTRCCSSRPDDVVVDDDDDDDDITRVDDVDSSSTASSSCYSRRTLGAATAAAAISVALSSFPGSSAASSSGASSCGGVTRVVLRTASITPDAAANYLVEALGLIKLDESGGPGWRKEEPWFEAPTASPLELRGGRRRRRRRRRRRKNPRKSDRHAILHPCTPSSSAPIIRLERAIALRAGASSAGAGERCSGDAFLGCAASVVGFPVVFVKTSAGRGAPAVVRITLRSRWNIRGGFQRERDDGGGVACTGGGDVGVLGDIGGGAQQPGVVERAAEDPPLKRKVWCWRLPGESERRWRGG